MTSATGRRSSAAAQLARAGFTDPDRALRHLGDAALADVVHARTGFHATSEAFTDATADLVAALGRTADPDAALLGVVRWVEALAVGVDRDTDPGRVQSVAAALNLLRGGDLPDVVGTRARLFAVLGGSSALTDHLVRHPRHWTVFASASAPDPAELRAELLAAVGADGGAGVPIATTGRAGRSPGDALRVAYRRRLVGLAGRDLSSPEPAAV
ncbi:MAG: hypothetical protein ACRYF3_10500, partial [Janthinobacterium lividum]